MEGDCSQLGNVHGENSYRGFDFQGSMSNLSQNQYQSVARQDPGLPLTSMVTSQDCVHYNLPITEYNNDGKGKNSTSEDNVEGHNESKKNSSWQRVKWMDKMVKLMITALSYINEDSGFNDNSGKKSAMKKSKWRLVSQAMEERGYRASPQQCEDKFNELNKRYKKLNEMLGRGTSCEVVENPALLDKIDYLNAKQKDEVRKIMSSKHLFYEEMCSYNNGNNLYLPDDPALQRSLQLMLGGCVDLDHYEHGKHQNEDLDDDDEGDAYGDCGGVHRGALGGPSKRLRRSLSHEDVGHSNHVSSRECNKGYAPRLSHCQADVSRGMSLESGKGPELQKKQILSKTLELEEQKLQIQAELMQLERHRFKWEIFSKKREQKLEKMRMENEKMRLENERMTLELKRAELDAKLS